MPESRGSRRSQRKIPLSATGQLRNRGDYVTFGRALLENPLYPDTRVIEELAGAMLRRMFSIKNGV